MLANINGGISDQADVLVDQVAGPISFLIGWLGKPEGMDGAPARVRVTTAEPDRVLGLVITDAVSVRGEPEDPNGEFSGPTESFIRLVSGRLGVGHNPSDVSATGSVSLDLLRRVFAGF